MKVLLLLLSAVLVCNPSFADTIILKNGSVIKGKIKTIHKSKMVFQTNFAGDITIDMLQVKDIETDNEVNLTMKDGNSKLLALKYNHEDLSLDEITMLWRKNKKAPNYKEPFKSSWQHTISAGVVKKSGNTDKMTLTLDSTSILTGKNYKFKLYTRYKNAESNGEKTDDETVFGLDYEHLLAKNNSWYLRMEGEKDSFEDIQLRITSALGYGHYFINNDNLELRGRAGVFHRYTSYENNRSASSNSGPDLGIHFLYKSSENWSWYSDLSYMPNFDQLSNFIMFHESAFVTPLGSTRWEFKIGIRNEYNSDASVGKEELDTTYFSDLQLKF